MLLHIHTFQLDVDGQTVTPWSQLTAKTRLLCVLLLVFAIALTPNGRWLTWAVYGIAVGAIVLVSRVTVAVLLRRVAVEFLFVGVVLLGTLFQSGGEVVYRLGGLQITTAGLTVLGSVTVKTLLSLLMLNILTLTTAIPDLLQGLMALRVPPLLVAILAAMVRYIGVLLAEFDAMQRAALSRNLMGRRGWQRLVIGNMMGALFIRTLDRGERVHRAMLSRGYDGLSTVKDQAISRQADRVALTLVGAIGLIGQTIYLFVLK
jgi:cobalt/nickel transport system permease protein